MKKKIKMNELIIIRSGSWENRCKYLEELITTNYGKIPQFNQQEREKFLSFIFENTIDLLDKSLHPNECRYRVLRLYCKLLNGQAESIGMLRYHLFNRLLANDLTNDEDIPYMIDFLMGKFFLILKKTEQ